MPADPVVSYLAYLQQMAKKIAYRGNTVDVLGKKSAMAPDRYLAQDGDSTETVMQRYLNGVVQDQVATEGRTLFLGVGLLYGRMGGKEGKKVGVSAPLVMIPCEVDEPDDQDQRYTCTPDWSAATLNYDMVTTLLEGHDVVDPEDQVGMPNQLSPAAATAIEVAERRIREAAASSGPSLRFLKAEFIESLMNNLRGEVPAFRERITAGMGAYRRDMARPQDGISWYNHRFYFMTQMPDSLSAYRALDKLAATVASTRQSGTTTLGRLLTNVLCKGAQSPSSTDQQMVDEVKQSLVLTPLPLSERQRQAIINGFAADISYIQGPPGTGKSHTIVGIMLTALLVGERVLLTSHKKAAVDVVRAKLRTLLGASEDVAIYIGADTDERAIVRARVNELINAVQSHSFPSMCANAQREEAATREGLHQTLRQIKLYRKALTAGLSSAKDLYDAHTEHLRHREMYQKAFGGDDLGPDYLGGIDSEGGEWEKVFDALVDIQTRRAAGETIAAKEILRAKMAVSRYARVFNAAWVPGDGWNAHRMQSHYQAIRALGESRRAENRISGNLNEIRQHIDALESTAVEQARKHLRAAYRCTQLKHAADCVGDLTNFASLFWLRKPRLVRPRMAAIDYAKITKVFPLWMGEMGHLGSILPFQAEIFDLAVVDEASQVNIAEIIPAFHRAKKICVVGDRAQLGLEAAGLFGLNRTFEELAWNQAFAGQHGIIPFAEAKQRELNVSSSSILDFIVSPVNGLGVPRVTLNEHYRSMPALAQFTSSEFYVSDGGLKIMTEVGQNLGKECFRLVEVGGSREDDAKVVPREVDKTMDLIKGILTGKEVGNGGPLRALGFRHPDHLPSVGVISFTTQQRDAIRNRIGDEIPAPDRAKVHLYVGTPEEFQGNERDVMILTFALGEGMARYAAAHYEKPTRFNVATSRARKFTYAVIGRCPARAPMLRRYFSNFGFRPTIENTIQDLGAPVEAPAPGRGSALAWRFDDRRCDSEFERVVLEALKAFIDRNPRRRIDIYNQVETCGEKRIDFVLYDRETTQSVAVEVDGIQHFCPDGVTYHDAHLERVAVLQRAGWRLVHLPYHRWYRNGWMHVLDSDGYRREVDDLHRRLADALFTPDVVTL